VSKKDSVYNFEDNLQELEHLVETLESGNLSLEDALVHFEQGIKKTQACQNALNTAEQRVKVLVETHSGIHLEDLENNNSTNT